MLFDPLEEKLFDAYHDAHPDTSGAPPEPRMTKTRLLLIANPPPKGAGAYVLVVKNGTQPSWAQLQDRTCIGRSETCDLVIRHPWVSDTHCSITRDGRDWCIDDCDSTNGVRVNSARVATHVLREGDAIQLGSHILIFVTGD